MKAKYGLKALTVLAREYGRGPVLIATLAASERIPHKFLELILLDLKRKGLLISKKGKGGGYHLSKPPSEITLGELVRILDGPVALLPCVSQSAYARCEDCVDENTCGLRHVMHRIGGRPRSRVRVEFTIDENSLVGHIPHQDVVGQSHMQNTVK